MSSIIPKLAFTLLFAAMAVACSQKRASPTNSTAQVDAPLETAAPPASTARTLPTLLPSASPIPTGKPTETRTPSPTEVPDTPIPFDEVVVELRYFIPGLGLDRTLQGTVASQLTITDEATGKSEVRRNQAGVLLELQQSLPELVLDDVPEGCVMCVQLEYDLPLAGEQDAGWLVDAQLLASVENFTTAVLGPHFPEGTIVAVRRSATPYNVAHSVAVTSDGQLWRWTATEPEIEGPENGELEALALVDELTALTTGQINDSYSAACPDGAGIEVLYFNVEDEDRQIQLVCPELSLPSKLLPLYLLLDDLAAEKMIDLELPKPEPPLPISSLIHLRRDDGAKLTLFGDGRAEAIDAEGITYTRTLTTALVISTTTSLVESGVLRPGVETFILGESPNILVVRGPEGVLELDWEDDVTTAVAPILERLQEVLEGIFDELAELEGDEPSPTETETPTPEATPES